jgi:hypothetical protein
LVSVDAAAQADSRRVHGALLGLSSVAGSQRTLSPQNCHASLLPAALIEKPQGNRIKTSRI